MPHAPPCPRRRHHFGTIVPLMEYEMSPREAAGGLFRDRWIGVKPFVDGQDEVFAKTRRFRADVKCGF